MRREATFLAVSSRWWGLPCCLLGGLIVSYGLFVGFLGAFFFRLDTAGELPEVLEWDVRHGADFAVGVFLLGFPPVGRSTARWFALLAVVSLLSWGIMSGGLMASHKAQHRIRTTLAQADS